MGHFYFTDVFAERSGDATAAQSLAKMDAQIDKLITLIGDLLDVTEIESGKLIFNYELFDFDNLIHESAEDIRLTIKHKIIVKGEVRKRAFADR